MISRRRPLGEEALHEAAHCLNAINLESAWSLCSLLSILEVLPKGEPELLLFPMLNQETVRLLADAIIASTSASYKTGRLDPHGFTRLINHVKDILGGKGGYIDLVPLHANGDQEFFTRFFMARLGGLQVRFQDFRFYTRVGRLIGMFEILPVSHRSVFSDEVWGQLDPIIANIRASLKHSVRAYAACLLVLWIRGDKVSRNLYPVLGAKWNQYVNASPPLTHLERQGEVLRHVVTVHSALDSGILSPTLQQLVSMTGGGIPEEIFADFMAIFARSTRELREFRDSIPMCAARHAPQHLSPLERYPIVRLSSASPEHFVVPNFRFLARNFADIIHFYLQDSVQMYNEVRGKLHELYLIALIGDRLPNIRVIPERSYRRGKNRVDGPDLTLIEGQQLILVESKAKRILAETRFLLDPARLEDNLNEPIRAINALPQKIADLYAGLPEYEPEREALTATQGSSPICLAVMGEEVVMMGEALHGLAEYRASYQLKGFQFPYAILGIDAFERAVEKAAREGLSLARVLLDYIQAASVITHDIPPADEFGGQVDESGTFAASFMQSVQQPSTVAEHE